MTPKTTAFRRTYDFDVSSNITWPCCCCGMGDTKTLSRRYASLVEDGVHSDDLGLALGMGVLLMRLASLLPQGSAEREVLFAHRTS